MKAFSHFWYRHSPQLFFGEVLEKRWMEAAVPFLIMCAMVTGLALAIPSFLDLPNLQLMLRDFAPPALVAMAMAFAVLSGGLDLSVGAVFAVANFVAIYLYAIKGFPFPVMILGVAAFGATVGGVNGYLVAWVKTRPFLTTMVMLIVLRGAYEKLIEAYTSDIAGLNIEGPAWEMLGGGSVFGIPTAALCMIIVGICAHLFLTRLRPGLHIMAVGSSRKAARHAGIAVKRTLFTAYVFSGTLAAIAGAMYAARQNSVGNGVGVGWEINALAAVVLGGISLAGGRGTIARAMIGAVVVFLLVNGLVRLGVHGSVTTALVGAILLLAGGFNVKWVKNKAKVQQKVYVVPNYIEFKPPPSIARGSGGPFAVNDGLRDSEAIGLDQIEGPEDIILDRQDRLYAVTRNGSIIRFSGPNFSHREEFVRIGGRPLGMAFDRDENLIVCVAGMGVYGVKPDRTVFAVTDETNRNWLRLKDDSRLSLADDLDIAPDGKIYFSEATVRYDLHNWALDGFEGRGNGRLICHDPKTGKTHTEIDRLTFPNGVCIAHDGKSVIFCSTWLCKVYRYWIDTSRKGELEVLIDNLPGYPDNINRASDGTYWLAFVGIRAPAFDLAMEDPGFRIRMVKQLPSDEWLIPGINYGCIIKFNDAGEVLTSLWDSLGESHPNTTSMREHKGYLYIGGLENNRIGRIKLDQADSTWTGWDSYWGSHAPSDRILKKVA